MKTPCIGCPFKNASTIENKNAVAAKLAGLKKVKEKRDIEFTECHNNRKTPCKGMELIKIKPSC
jgi:hypothetical protein